MFNLNATQTNLTLTSPSWPNQYSNNLDCRWVITAQPEMIVVLTIKEFNTERNYDFLTVILYQLLVLELIYITCHFQ